jgi:hypothetical protein
MGRRATQRAAPSNKGMKLTKPERNGALQLIPGVRPTHAGGTKCGKPGRGHGARPRGFDGAGCDAPVGGLTEVLLKYAGERRGVAQRQVMPE